MEIGRYWDSVEFTRSTDTWQVVPGAAIATIGFGLTLSWGYAKLFASIPGTELKKGRNFGLIVFVLVMPFAEMWNYLQLVLPFMVVVAGLLHYLITLPLAGTAIAWLYRDNRGTES